MSSINLSVSERQQLLKDYSYSPITVGFNLITDIEGIKAKEIEDVIFVEEENVPLLASKRRMMR